MARTPDDTGGTSWAYLAPVDLREHELPAQAAFGFHRGRTEELLRRAADTIERLNRELAEIREAKERWKQERRRLETQLGDEKTRAELLVGEAMLDAHKAGQALRAEAEADAEELRAEAEALLEPARQEATRLVAEARENARQLVAGAEAECERLATLAEQYKLLAADVRGRSVEVLRRALEALGETGDANPAGDAVAPFRKAAPDAPPSRSHDDRSVSPHGDSPPPQPAERQQSEPLDEGRREREAWPDECDVRSQPPGPSSIPSRGTGPQQSSLADDPMTRLWQAADNRETGAEAVEAIRARRRNPGA